MSAKNFQSMSELAKMVHEKVSKLESGNLSAEELGGLSDELRDLYDRIVILKYKAMEKGLKVDVAARIYPAETVAVAVEKPKEVAPVEIQPMKFTVADTPSTVVKSMEDKKVEVKAPEVVQPKTEQIPSPKLQPGLFEIPAAKKENTVVTNPVSTEQKTSIAEKYAAQQKATIAEKFAAEQKMTLADKLKMSRINDLRTAIGINQKFLFMNDLFEGENMVFNEAINRVNSCNSGDEAKTVLTEYSMKYGWSGDSERVMQFFELIERRYL